MKHFFIVASLFVSFGSLAQDVLPMLDFNRLMKSFENGFFRQVASQPVREFKAGDNVVGYVDFRTNLVVYDGGNPTTLANVETEFQVSDFLLTWKIATTLNLWDDGEQQTLTYRVGDYIVKDSLVVFQDLRYNTVKVYYNGTVTDLYTVIDDLYMPQHVGENIVAFRDNGNFYKVFWRGKIYELDVWHQPYKFSTGIDMVAFNDPVNGTFAIFQNGQFLDVENFFMSSYKVGNGFVAYENQNHDLKIYQNGEIKTLSNFGATSYDVKDGIVYWIENGFSYAYVDGQKFELAIYVPEDYAIKNDVVVFRNLMGGVTALQGGKIHVITNQMDAEFSIHGNAVLVELFNKPYIVLQEGRKFQI